MSGERTTFIKSSRVVRRILVDCLIVVIFAAVGWFCYDAGKSYNIILENVAFTVDGIEYPGIEAMQVTIDGRGEPIYMLEDDRMVGMASGKRHTLMIEILDEDDRPIEEQTKMVTFTMKDLGPELTINTAKAYALGKVN